MTTPVVVCNDVRKQYGDKAALSELNLSIPSGGIVGILGPNGSGKSTLFRLLMNLTRPNRGQIKVLGKQPGWTTNAEIAYLPDRARWYSDHTVEQAFAWGKNFLPQFQLLTAVDLAATMKLDLGARISGLSRGQEARLMLIMCIARTVPLIILDEPFSGIDVISREQIISGIIEHLSETDQTILISTHEISEVESMFDYVVVLQDGQLKLAGVADELRAEHGSIYGIMKSIG